MFSNNPVSQSMIDAVNKVLGEAPQAAAPAQPVEQPNNPFAPQLLDESDEKVNPEESKCVTEPKAKEIAKKEVKGHEKKLHQKEDMTFANKLKCSIKEGKATGTEEIFTDNNLGEEEMSDKQKAKREKIVMSMKGDEAGLKQRYGKNWKNVMYATATKQAMAEEVVDESFEDEHGIGKSPKKNQDVADKAYLKHKPGTVKGTMTQLGRFLKGKPEIKEEVEELDEWTAKKVAGASYAEKKAKLMAKASSKLPQQKEVKEDIEVQVDKSEDTITTDMLRGRVSGGKLNSFRNYKVDLKTSGKEPVPVECDKGVDTKEKQKISTNPGPVDIKLDDNLTTPPQSHFSKDKQIKNEEVRGELKSIRSKQYKMQDKEVTDYRNKHIPGGLVTSNEEVEFDEVLDEAVSRKDFQMVADLIKTHDHPGKRKELAQHHAEIFSKQNPRFDHAKFMKAAGVNEATIAGSSGWEPMKKDVKDKSGAVHTPMSRAKDLARQSFKKIKSDLGKNK